MLSTKASQRGGTPATALVVGLLSRLLYAGLALALIAISAALAVAVVPRFLGYGTVAISGGSMEQSIPTGSLIIARWLPDEQVRVGQVIVAKEPGRAAIAHRVVSLQTDGGNVLVQTKGDANPTPDPRPYVLPPRVLTPEHVIPYLGYLVLFVKTPLGLTFLVTLPATALCLYLLRRIWSGGPPTTETALRGGEGAA